jgi:tetratricopeptide (TPR) repeat protein
MGGSLVAALARVAAGYLLGAGNYASARRVLDWGLRYAPDDPDLNALRGQCCLRTAALLGPRRLPDAIAFLEEADSALERAIAARPRDWELHRQQGLTLLRLAWAREAREPGSPQRDLLRQAVDAMSVVLEAQPRRADVLHERGMAWASLRVGAPEGEAEAALGRALEDLDSSLRMRPHAYETQFHRAELSLELARLHRRAGRRGAEKAAASAALDGSAHLLRARPGWEPVLLLRALAATALARLGEDPLGLTDLAISSASAVLEQDPRHARALLVRAEARVITACHLALQSDVRAGLVWRQALADLESASDAVGLRGREDVGALRAGARGEWGLAQHRAGAIDGARDAWIRALEDFDRAVDDDPVDADRLTGRARVLAGLADLAPRPDERAERRRRAFDDLDQAAAIRPGDTNLLALRASLVAAPGALPEELAAALKEVEGALEATPEHAALHEARRRLLLLLAMEAPPGPQRALAIAAALLECDRAVREEPADPQAHYDQARALFLGGRPAEAYAALEQAIRAAPGLRHTARQDPVWAPVADAEGFRQLVER